MLSPIIKLSAVTALSMALALPISAHAESSGHKSPWGYTGDTGPNHWGSIGFPTCSEGKNQSPVNIDHTASAKLDPIAINYVPTPINVLNNGHTVQFNYGSGSHITVGGKRYDLLQFHFHSLSENTVGGKAYPMEVHLVHKSGDGKLAVIGVFIEAGAVDGHNETLNTVFGALAGSAGLTLKDEKTILASDLLPENQAYYHFMGSLTTPPCSEGVNWLLMQNPIQVSANQLMRFRTIFSNNARPTQPWNQRTSFSGTGQTGAASPQSSGH